MRTHWYYQYSHLIFQVITGILLQLFNTRSQCTSNSANKLDKLLGRLKTFALDDRAGSSGFSTFEYPKEDTTHGVGYGVSTDTVFLRHQIKHPNIISFICVIKTNLKRYLSSVYSISQPLQVSDYRYYRNM